MDAAMPTESELREGLRKRRTIFPDVTVDQPVTLPAVDAEFRAARRNRADIGIANHVLSVFLAPRNPFEPKRARKPKMEAVVFGTLLVLVVVAVLAFNLAAARPY